MLDLDQLIEESIPVPNGSLPSHDSTGARRLFDSIVTGPVSLPAERTDRRRRTARVVTACGVAAAVTGVIVFQTLPGSVSAPSSASAAQFFKTAAKTVIRTAALSGLSGVIPQPGQFIYSETEDPNGATDQTWLSVDGTSPGWTQSDDGGTTISSFTIAPCTVADVQSGQCFPEEVGFLQKMPTNPTALLAYLVEIGVGSPADSPNVSLPGWSANDLGKGLMSLMESTYLLPAQKAAIFNLLAQTPGFTVAGTMPDAIGREGTGIEWSFEGGTAALIFDPTTYALLGVRTWPEGAGNSLSAPYDGNALSGISIVNSIPTNQP